VAILDSLSDVGVFVRDLKKAKAFYTKKLGLKVRSSMPQVEYLALGATKGGADASLNLWQPVPTWGPDYDEFQKQIGVVTGIGFLTSDLKKTAVALGKKGIEVKTEGEGGRFGRFSDPDGNELFIVQPSKTKVHRAGLSSLAFLTVVSRDAKASREFFQKALGLKARRVPGEEGEGEFVMLQLSPKGTGIAPFTPTREMYEDAKDYDEDMAHVGEDTSVMFTTKDVYKAQDALMARGVRFSEKAEKKEWGGIQAKFLDPDDNEYAIVQMVD
jgi:catechol 2,3-dioxygenase-like lactoylglutathione lyase family enzyme